MVNSAIKHLQHKANRSAELFVNNYYSTYDSINRSTNLPKLYHSDARIVWNGNAISGIQSLSNQLINQLPFTKHEIQSYDCHLISASQAQSPDSSPTLSITITGQLIYASTSFPSTYIIPDYFKSSSSSNQKNNLDEKLDGLPRIFSQSFILVSVKNLENGSDNYQILADSFRFVG
ncbi:uncharacterized protein MELLADRAFT_91004 [Melampsora larici-populina 98AG31]|uniref:NTF2 domain-containing protein n=1 Tax=Melampsora larici-populina (strain 98AG31 / pathotype 3-4-7) TaxID=747676 RepID=F4R8C0_MELLP|nr:uncharacterized protein MELLADRAFT_91004 [Melampsora larici-populina 98AG31]EGG11636.1 hypothetical protein MELLADRAFT_91004 [Melampsora larici-populina 98AG31]